MSLFQKILVPVDGSSTSNKALEQALLFGFGQLLERLHLRPKHLGTHRLLLLEYRFEFLGQRCHEWDSSLTFRKVNLTASSISPHATPHHDHAPIFPFDKLRHRFECRHTCLCLWRQQ